MPMLRLMVIAGPDAGMHEELEEESVSLGRAPTNRFVLTDPRVSGRHGEINRVGEGYRYQDLGSRNGSKLVSPGVAGPARVAAPVALSDGDAIALGPGTLVAIRTTVTANAEVSVARDSVAGLLEHLERDPVRLLALFQFERQLARATTLPELWGALVEGLAAAFPGATRVTVLSAPGTPEGGAEVRPPVPRPGAAPAVDLQPVMVLDRRRGITGSLAQELSGDDAGTAPAEPGDGESSDPSRPAGAPRPEGVVLFSRAAVGDAWEKQMARLYHDSFHDLPLAAEGHAWPIFSTMCAPLIADGERLGAVQIDHRAGAASFDADDLDLFAALCHRAAMALQSERLRDQRQESRGAQLALAIDRDIKDWSVLISGLTDDLAGSLRRLFATLDTGDSATRARVAGEREYTTEALETLRANVGIAKEIAFPLSSYVLARPIRLELEPVDVETLLRQVARTERPRASHEIDVVDASLPPINADRARLFRALLNLVQNAVEATRGRSDARVTLSAAVVPDEAFPGGRCLAIRVADTGAGMGPDLLARLRAGEEVTTRPQGTGLGVRITRDILEAHGGTLSLESEAGQGTTVTAKLPL